MGKKLKGTKKTLKDIKYPQEIIDMIVNRGNKSVRDILPELHEKFPKYKHRLNTQNATSLGTYYRSKYNNTNNKLKNSNKRSAPKNAMTPLVHSSQQIQNKVLTRGLELSNDGKTPTAVRDVLAEEFDRVILPPARELKQAMKEFAYFRRSNGATNTSAMRTVPSFKITIEGPDTKVTRHTTEALAMEALSLMFNKNNHQH